MHLVRSLALGAILLPLASSAQTPANAPQAEQAVLRYYDADASRFAVETPFVQGETGLVGLGERFTLPAPNGVLDSLRITFQSGEGDKGYSSATM